MTHWNVEQVFGEFVLVWIWNRLGLPDRVVLIGNIFAMVATAFFVFLK